LIKLIRLLTTRYYLKGFYRILWAARIFLKTRDNVYSIYGTVKMKLDHNHYYQWMIASSNYYAFGIMKLLSDFLRQGDVFIDVGANIGYLSLIASFIVGEDGLVVAFEPDPRARRSFSDSIALNEIRNIVLLEYVCSDREGKVSFKLASHLGWSTAVEKTPSLDIVGQIEVSQCTLDNVIATDIFKGKKIRLIKIDTEGYEPYILEGAKAIIDGNETAFIIEINHPALTNNNHSIKDILRLFMDKNYHVYWIDEKRNFINSLRKIKLEKVINCNNYHGRNGDVFVVPAHIVSQLIRN
jgi:FkbM family methyltransferase